LRSVGFFTGVDLSPLTCCDSLATKHCNTLTLPDEFSGSARPPVNSPETAVKVAIAHEIGQPSNNTGSYCTTFTREALAAVSTGTGSVLPLIYTLLGSCRRHGINPFDYLKDLFTRLPSAKITDIKQFTPAAWVRDKAKEKLPALAA